VDASVQSALERDIARLSDEEAALDQRVRSLAEGFSGLKDIDLVLALAKARLELCTLLLRRLARAPEASREAEHAAVTAKARAALRLVEGLAAENVSEDQRDHVLRGSGFDAVKEALQGFLLAGGGILLEEPRADERRARMLSRAVVASIRKFMTEDDTYAPLEVDRYPAFIRDALLFLFPVLLREKPEKPPYGIEEGGEVTYSSRAMKLPLSQAVFYIENELLPGLRERLAEDPGNEEMQREIRRLEDRAEEYRRLRFFPRSEPVVLEKGFHTDGMTSYSADGELLVPIPVSVTWKSGTNLDRKMELVRADLVKRIAGRGVSAEVDAEYSRLRSLQSGLRGSSRLASMKVDAAGGFRALRQSYPFLSRLEDKEKFRELAEVVRTSGQGAQRRIAALVQGDGEKAGGAARLT
jgi:hypothetical protein